MKQNHPWSIVLGTRPEIIKMAPVIRACQQREVPVGICQAVMKLTKGVSEIRLVLIVLGIQTILANIAILGVVVLT